MEGRRRRRRLMGNQKLRMGRWVVSGEIVVELRL